MIFLQEQVLQLSLNGECTICMFYGKLSLLQESDIKHFLPCAQ